LVPILRLDLLQAFHQLLDLLLLSLEFGLLIVVRLLQFRDVVVELPNFILRRLLRCLCLGEISLRL
jgi:hypothetical protein